MRYERSSRIARHFVSRKVWPFSTNRHFFNISKYAGPVKGFEVMNFMSSSTLLASAQMRCVPSIG
jgi:hypothetical protein